MGMGTGIGSMFGPIGMAIGLLVDLFTKGAEEASRKQAEEDQREAAMAQQEFLHGQAMAITIDLSDCGVHEPAPPMEQSADQHQCPSTRCIVGRQCA